MAVFEIRTLFTLFVWLQSTTESGHLRWDLHEISWIGPWMAFLVEWNFILSDCTFGILASTSTSISLSLSLSLSFPLCLSLSVSLSLSLSLSLYLSLYLSLSLSILLQLTNAPYISLTLFYALSLTHKHTETLSPSITGLWRGMGKTWTQENSECARNGSILCGEDFINKWKRKFTSNLIG